MITIFKTIDGNFEKIDDFEKGCWVNVVFPTNADLEELSQKLKVPLDFLTDTQDINERSRIEVEDDFTLIVLRIPIFDKKNEDIPYTTIPLGIIFNQNLFITVAAKNNEVVTEFSSGKIKNFTTQNKSQAILNIFLRTAIHYLKYLKEINQRTNDIEKDLHIALKNEELIKLLNIQKSLVFFTTSLRANEIMMDRLQKLRDLKLSEDDLDLLSDVVVESKQAIEMANVYSNILTGMMDAFASIISNNLNMVLKFLTSVTLILMIPTLIVSTYGMNLNLPFQHHQHSFFIVVMISISLSIISVLLFYKRKWF